MPEILTDNITRHRPSVRGFVLRMVRDETLAEDLTQETFLKARRHADSYRGEAKAKSWLCAIALNLVRDYFRAAGRGPETTTDANDLDAIADDQVNAEQALLEAEMSACINEFLIRLPSPQADVVALHDLAGLAHGEIAAALGISEANSRVLLHRGRAALRELLRKGCVLNFGGDAIPCERPPPNNK